MDQVGEDEGRRAALALDGLHEDGAVLYAIVDESVRYAEVLLGILSNFILHRYIEVFEIFGPFCVLFATGIEYVRNALLDQLLGFEGGLEGAHVNAGVHLEQVDLLEGDGAVYLAGADREVRETAAHYLFFVAFVLHNWLRKLLLLMNQVDIVLNLVNVHLLGNHRRLRIILHFHFLRVRLI